MVGFTAGKSSVLLCISYHVIPWRQSVHAVETLALVKKCHWIHSSMTRCNRLQIRLIARYQRDAAVIALRFTTCSYHEPGNRWPWFSSVSQHNFSVYPKSVYIELDWLVFEKLKLTFRFPDFHFWVHFQKSMTKMSVDLLLCLLLPRLFPANMKLSQAMPLCSV